MPWDVIHEGKEWVVRDKKGKAYGRHKSKKDARQQQKALYAAEGRKGKSW